jgi:phosphatidylserine decarboxylase
MPAVNLVLRFYTFIADLISSIFVPKIFRKGFFTFFGRVFMKMNDNDFSIMEKDISEFKNIKDFFIRRINLQERPLCKDDVVCPCDGRILEFGNMEDGQLIQVKGINYRLSDLIIDGKLCGTLQNGSFVSVYLSPRNYHRFHCPCSGSIISIRHIPGYLLPVNSLGLKVPALYTRNERFIVTFQAKDGTLITLAIVGAAAVSKIVLFNEENQKVCKGDELGYFEMGSSIVLISSKRFTPVIKKGETVLALGPIGL